VGIRKTNESKPVCKASKQNHDGIKTGAYSLLREQHGGNLLTREKAQAAEPRG